MFLLPALYDRDKSHQHVLGSFSLLIYTHTGHWAAFLAIDQFLLKHHHNSRQQVSLSNGQVAAVKIHPQGYLDFYVQTKNLRRAPFYILSVGNALLMMAVVILNDFCDSSYSCLHTFTKVLKLLHGTF